MYEVAQEVQLAPLEKASERASRLHDQSIDDLRAWAPSERGQREQTRASCDVVMQALDALQGMREATTLQRKQLEPFSGSGARAIGRRGLHSMLVWN